MISRDPRRDICRQLESAKDDLEFTLYLAADCAKAGNPMMTDRQYDEIKRDFNNITTVLNSLQTK